MSLPKIKIIFSDLDGTLLSPKKYSRSKVNTETISALGKFLEDKNNHLVLATGRNHERTKEISNWLEERLGGYKIPYLICLNGALLIENKTQKVIYSKFFRCSSLLKVIQFLRRHFAVSYFILTEDKKLYIENEYISRLLSLWFSRKYNSKILYSTEEDYRKNWEKIQKVIIITLHFNSDYIRQIIESKFSEFYVSTHGSWLLEIIDRKINKFYAIQTILNREGWDLNECCGIGNEGNDIMMIEKCGFGVAVDFDLKQKNLTYDHRLIQYFTTNKEGKSISNTISKLI